MQRMNLLYVYAIVVISLGVTLVSPTIMASLGNETWVFRIFEPTAPDAALMWLTFATVFALFTVFGGWVAKVIGQVTSFLGTAAIGTVGFAAAIVVTDYLFGDYDQFRMDIWFVPAVMRDVLVAGGVIALAAAAAGLAVGTKLFVVRGSSSTPSPRLVSMDSVAPHEDEEREDPTVRLATTRT